MCQITWRGCLTTGVRSLKLKTQFDFEQGLEYYRTGDLTNAKTYSEKVLTVNATDKTAQLYVERVEILAERGIPDNWTGVWTFSEK